MNWWAIGLSLAGVGGVALLLYVFGLGGIVKLAGALVRLVVDGATQFVQWLRKPGSKIRALAAILAFISISAGLQSWKRGQVIVTQRADYAALESRSAQAQEALRGNIAQKDQAIAVFTRLAETQMRLLEQAKRDNAEAVARAVAAEAEAAKSNQKYQQAFDQRPPECKAALDVMAQACSTLREY